MEVFFSFQDLDDIQASFCHLKIGKFLNKLFHYLDMVYPSSEFTPNNDQLYSGGHCILPVSRMYSRNTN